MNKLKNSQVLVLLVLVFLLVITPLLPSSLRPTYLYFIFNFLIIALGAEAGLLSVISRPLDSASVTQKPVMSPEVLIPNEKSELASRESAGSEHAEKRPNKVVFEKLASEKAVCVVNVDKVQKCPSVPSLFFIGSGEADADPDDLKDEEHEAEDEIEGFNGQELSAKAEAFIGNFYKQLKMQREESWIYQKAY